MLCKYILTGDKEFIKLNSYGLCMPPILRKFLLSFGGMLDITPVARTSSSLRVREKCNSLKTRQDRDSIASDFRHIGNDIRRAMDKLAHGEK